MRSAGLVFALVALAAILAHALHAVASDAPGEGAPVADWLYCGLFVATALSCGGRAVRERRAGGNWFAWTVAAVGVTLWAGAEISYRALEPDPYGTYPLMTQGILAISFGLASVTLLLLSRNRIEGFHKGPALDGLIGGLAVAAVAASLLFPVGFDAEQETPPFFFLLADLGILTFVVVTIGLTGWRPGACWGLMCAGIVVNAIGNIGLIQASEVGAFHRGGLVDTLYVTSALLLGIAAWYPIRPSVRRSEDEVRRVAAPLGFALVALGLLFVATFERVSPLAVLLATAALGLIVARTALAFRDNRHLLSAREHDSLTDGLTGLGNRRQLMRKLDEAAEEAAAGEPRVVMLFDLDGFKSYNDAFGHSAGDALLARLGWSLKQAIGAHGSAYRLGGDEFCAIVRSDSLKIDAVLAGACEALSEAGTGFSVGPSYGIAVLGNEAETGAHALQLADQRMYAEKHGRQPVAREARAVLLRILREREPDLDGHLHAVARLARRVAAEMGAENEELDLVTRAAELHDIGKMATPDAILHKPGSLTENEWAIMRRHTVIGERVLNTVPALRPVGEVVRATHERWDGNGYPDGLAGEQIPLQARIIFVCDSYNAITSERPYDPAKSHDEAMEEIRRCAGSQFDPEVVEVFCRIDFGVGIPSDGVPAEPVPEQSAT